MIEPNAQDYKDDVRKKGEALGLSHEVVWRHPSPGPGTAIRVVCQDKPYKTGNYDVLKQSVARKVDELSWGLFEGHLIPVRTVGVQGDARTYSYLAILAGESRDWSTINKVANQLPKEPEVKGYVNRVEYLLSADTLDTRYLENIVPTRLTFDVVKTIQDIHYIGETELRRFNAYDAVAQMPFVLFPVDLANTGGRLASIRGIVTDDFMTGQAAFPPRVPEKFFYSCDEKFRQDGRVNNVSMCVLGKPPTTTEAE